MATRRGVSLLETLVVIALIGVLTALLFPAVQAARRRALEVQCQNNLRQLNLAVADYYEANKRLPGPGTSGKVDGWTIDVLPFIEQQNLYSRITPGIPIAAAPDILLRQPRVFRCPTRTAGDELPPGTMEPSSYVLIPGRRRKVYGVSDAPLAASVPWASGPEMRRDDVVRQTGPHRDGYFYANGFQNAVSFVAGGQ